MELLCQSFGPPNLSMTGLFRTLPLFDWVYLSLSWMFSSSWVCLSFSVHFSSPCKSHDPLQGISWKALCSHTFFTAPCSVQMGNKWFPRAVPWVFPSPLLTKHPQTSLREPELLPLREQWVRNLSAGGSFWGLPPPGVRGEAKRNESQESQESQSSCRGCCWTRRQWLGTPRELTRGKARRQKGLGGGRREKQDI